MSADRLTARDGAQLLAAFVGCAVLSLVLLAAVWPAAIGFDGMIGAGCDAGNARCTYREWLRGCPFDREPCTFREYAAQGGRR